MDDDDVECKYDFDDTTRTTLRVCIYMHYQDCGVSEVCLL
jgi:hypothetical protein